MEEMVVVGQFGCHSLMMGVEQFDWWYYRMLVVSAVLEQSDSHKMMVVERFG
jgi:hypothetical protein